MKSENIQKIILDIKENCNLSKRSVEDVTLIGASKSQTIEKIIIAYEEGIKNFVENLPSGSNVAIGTEINMVARLADSHPDKHVECLDDKICPCSTMYLSLIHI